MAKSKQRQGLSGTVLIMILTVMFVLIIMLMATLTVVTTASQRIYTKFEENQAYYTSRSALEVITAEIFSDNAYIGTNANIAAPAADKEYQGFQMQAALYTVEVVDDSGNPVAGKNIDIYGDVDKEFLEYQITLPAVGNPADKYGSFSDGNDIYLKVEVLDRVYDIGGDGTVNTGNRAKDSLKVKITAISEVNGVEGTASVLIESGPKTGATNTTRAVTTLSGSAMAPNNCAILGGIATMGNVTFGNMGDYWGDFYIGTDTDIDADGISGARVEYDNGGSRVTVVGDDWYYINGSVVATENHFPLQGFDTTAGKEPVVYISGDLLYDYAESMGTATNPVTIIVAGDCKANSASGKYIHYGDLYVMGDLKAPMDFTIHGNLYVDGDADFLDTQNGSNLLNDVDASKGNGYFNGNVDFRVNDAGVVGTINGTVHMTTTPGTVFDNVTYSFGTAVDYEPDISIENAGLATESIHIELPNGDKADIPTMGNLYTGFYRYDDMAEGCITASEYAFTTQEDFDAQIYSQKRIHEYYNEQAAAATTTQIVSNSGGVFVAPGKYHMTQGQYMHNVEFNTGGEVELFLDPGYYSRGGSGGKVIVHPGTTLKVYCIPGNYYFTDFCFTTPEVDSGSNNLYVGDIDDPANGIYLMDIPTTFYIEGESTMSFYNGSSYIIGNIYGPRATIDAGSSGTGSFVNRLYYNLIPYGANSYTSGYGFTVVGSVLADSYITGGSGKGSVAYVMDDDEGTPPPLGVPFLNFKDVKYSRN